MTNSIHESKTSEGTRTERTTKWHCADCAIFQTQDTAQRLVHTANTLRYTDKQSCLVRCVSNTNTTDAQHATGNHRNLALSAALRPAQVLATL